MQAITVPIKQRLFSGCEESEQVINIIYDAGDFMKYRQVQNIAKDTFKYIKSIITPDMNLCDIRQLCEDKMFELGADSFWYWNIGAFVFCGDETAVSVSGREYVTSDRMIAKNDIVTVDLSPQNNKIWGDFARTIIIENGKVVENIESIKNTEWRNGLLMQEALHNELKAFATRDTTFEDLYYHINNFIKSKGYINLDFLGNLGHSIAKDKTQRIYIEKGNTQKLGEVNYFTFEPHISVVGSLYGYKKENIYYFNDNTLAEL